MKERQENKLGFVVVADAPLDWKNEERPEPGCEGQVHCVVSCGMGVNRFYFADPEEARIFAAMVEHAAEHAARKLAEARR
jgi:hypothetical protein